MVLVLYKMSDFCYLGKLEFDSYNKSALNKQTENKFGSEPDYARSTFKEK